MRITHLIRRARTAFTLFDRMFRLRERPLLAPRLPARGRVRLGLLALEDRLVPDGGGRPLPLPTIYAGAGPGSAPVVHAYNTDTGALNFSITAYEAGFTGGVNVATADFNGDAIPDVVTGPGAGGGPRIEVFDGATGKQFTSAIGSFYAYDPAFTGGVQVAVGDVNGDGVPDVVTAAGPGGGPHVEAFSGADGSLLASFYAFDPAFTGGIHVAAADLTRDGHAEVIVGAGEGGGPRVKVYDLAGDTPTPVAWSVGNFFAYDSNSRGGVWVATGDVNGDTIPDVITGSGAGIAPEVKVFDGSTGVAIGDFPAFDSGMTAGVRVGAAYLDDNPYADVVAATGPGVTAEVKEFSAGSGKPVAGPLADFTPFGADDTGGVNIAAGNDPGSSPVTVTRPAPSPSSIVSGQQFTLTATVTPVSGSTTPTGTVTMYITPSGGGPIAVGTAALTPATSPAASATVVVTDFVLPSSVSSYTFTASYSGDATYAAGSPSGLTPSYHVGAASGPPAGPTGDLAAGGDPTGAEPPPRLGAGGVRASDGTFGLSRTDLTGGGFGTPWGVTWSWSNAAGYSNDVAGTGSALTPLPQIVQVNGTASLALVGSATDARFFDQYLSGYHSRYGDPTTLVEDAGAGTLTATDATGAVSTFYDFSFGTPAGRAGQLQSVTDPAGNVTAVTSWDATGRPAEIQRTAGSGSTAVTESFVYAYVGSGVNAGLVASVTQRRKVGTGSWGTVRSVAYTYYDGSQTYGLAGDLQLAVTKDPSGTAIDTTYYRYYTSSSSTGYSHGLKYAFDAAAYARLTGALGTGVDSLTDTQVAPYATDYLEYDSSQRVTKHTAAGAGTFTYAYSASSFIGGANVWSAKTVETLPDGNSTTDYENALGEIILSVYTDAGTSQQWATFTEYDDYGRVVLTAAPSAVTGFSDTYPDLLDNTGGNYADLSDAAGLVTTSAFAAATTATGSTAGDAAGYLSAKAIRQGETGTSVPQEADSYIQRTAGGTDFYFPAEKTVYRNDNGTGGETTTTGYTWQGSTAMPASVTTTLPVVTTGENGPGGSTGTSSTVVYDAYGRPEWAQDAGGFLTYTQYDVATGAVVKQIRDVNTADTGDFADLPSGWTTPSGGGLELITAAQVDALGRPTAVTSPGGNVTYAVYNDPQHETLTYPGWNGTTNAPTGPTRVTRDDRADGYTETFTMSAAPHLTGGVPDGTETVGGLQSLTRQSVNAAGQVTSVDNYFNLGGLGYTTGTMGTSGTNFYRTQYGYDVAGRQDRVVDPTGTVTRAVYDGQGRKVSEWVGTNDTPGSGSWSPTNNTSPANMADVTDDQYDGGGVGDGTLTKVTRHPGGGAADRVTQTWYDWRDRAVAEKDGVSATETDGANRPLTVITYDNLNEKTEIQQYAADGVTPSISGGVLSLPSGTSSDLRAQTVTSYDELGRVYQTQQYDVDPSSGSVSSTALTTNDYYDARGNVAAASAPGGQWTKDQYDGAGRKTYEYTTDGAGGNGYSAATGVSGDDVLTQTQTVYDGDGNAIETVTRDRFHTDGTSPTGALGTATTGIEARVSYQAAYYDAADRKVADVDVGTNGGSAWTRPSGVPTGSGTVLVTGYAYAADAVQTVTLTGSPTGGTFTLSFGGQTTSGIAYNASAATVQSALQGLSSVGSGNAVVTAEPGGGWQLRFAGTLAGAFRAAVAGNGAGLTGGASPAVAVNVVSAGGDAGTVTATTDPLGLVTRNYADALGRTTERVADYTGAAETATTDVATEYTYDGAGHTLTVKADATGGAYEETQFVYGVTTAGSSGVNSNDLLAATEYPDPSTGAPSTTSKDTQTVNAFGQVVTKTDRNGTVHTYTYDTLGRPTVDAVTTLGSGVDGSVRRIETAYDGQGNPSLVTSYTAASGGSVVNQVQRVYDGLGQLTTEYQATAGSVNTSTTPKVQYAYTEMAGGANNSRQTGMTYPSGYALSYTYASGLDASTSRLSAIADSGNTLEGYKYLGLGTVAERDHPQDTVNQTFISQTGGTGDGGDQYVGLDRFGRVADQNWYNTSTSSSVEDVQYGHDADGNVLWRNDTVNTAFGELYTYDGLNQLATFQRGTLNGTKTGLTGSASASQSWTPDALGNFTSVTTNGTTQTRTANQQNEVTGVSGATTPTYSSAGEMTTDETGLQYVYDAWGRVVTVKSSGGSTLESLTYDGLGRQVTSTAGGTTTTFYYSAQGQVVEEWQGGAAQARNVWSPVYVNALVVRDQSSLHNGTLDQRLYEAQDMNWNLTALVDSGGSVVERYAYLPFGETTVLNTSWSAISGSVYGSVYLFQGMRQDLVSSSFGTYSRWYNPILSRWTRNDPLGFDGQDTNLTRMVRNNPVKFTDPSGEIYTPQPRPGNPLGNQPNPFLPQPIAPPLAPIPFGSTPFFNIFLNTLPPPQSRPPIDFTSPQPYNPKGFGDSPRIPFQEPPAPVGPKVQFNIGGLHDIDGWIFIPFLNGGMHGGFGFDPTKPNQKPGWYGLWIEIGPDPKHPSKPPGAPPKATPPNK